MQAYVSRGGAGTVANGDSLPLRGMSAPEVSPPPPEGPENSSAPPEPGAHQCPPTPRSPPPRGAPRPAEPPDSAEPAPALLTPSAPSSEPPKRSSLGPRVL